MAILTTALRRAGIPERLGGVGASPGEARGPPRPLRRRPPRPRGAGRGRGTAAAAVAGLRPAGRRAHRLMGVQVLYADVDGTMVGPLGNLFWDSDRNPTLAAAEALVRASPGGAGGRGPHRPGPGRHVRVRPGPRPGELDLRAGRHPGLRPGGDGRPRARRVPRHRGPHHRAPPGGRASPGGLPGPPRGAQPLERQPGVVVPPPGRRRHRRGRGPAGDGRLRLGDAVRQRRHPPPLRDPARDRTDPGLPPHPPGRVEGGRRGRRPGAPGPDPGRVRHGRRRRRRPRGPGRGGPLLPDPQRPRQGPVPGLGARNRAQGSR